MITLLRYHRFTVCYVKYCNFVLISYQSIRDQMASSLTRLKDLEEEVKTIPMLQVRNKYYDLANIYLNSRVAEISKTNGHMLLSL